MAPDVSTNRPTTLRRVVVSRSSSVTSTTRSVVIGRTGCWTVGITVTGVVAADLEHALESRGGDERRLRHGMPAIADDRSESHHQS